MTRVILLLILGSQLAYGQTSSSKIQATKSVIIQPVKSIQEELQDIIVIHYKRSNYQILYTEELLNRVKSVQRPDVPVELKWDEETTITVLPYKSQYAQERIDK